MRREYFLHVAKKKVEKLERNISDDWMNNKELKYWLRLIKKLNLIFKFKKNIF